MRRLALLSLLAAAPLAARAEPEAFALWPDSADALKAPAIPAATGKKRAKKRVFLDAGHGDRGRTGAQNVFCEPEHALNRVVTDEVALILEATGRFEVRKSDPASTLQDRVRAAAEWGAEVFVSIHADARGEPTAWQAPDGRWCWREDRAPGFSVLWSDAGKPRLNERRNALARAVARRMQDAGFLAYGGLDYLGIYDGDPLEPGVFVDRHEPRRRVYVLKKPRIPSIVIETHHGLDLSEATRWSEQRTREVFGACLAAALSDFLLPREVMTAKRGPDAAARMPSRAPQQEAAMSRTSFAAVAAAVVAAAAPAAAAEQVTFAGCDITEPDSGEVRIRCPGFSASASREQPDFGRDAVLDSVVKAMREGAEAVHIERAELEVAGVARQGLRYSSSRGGPTVGTFAAVPASAGHFRLVGCEEAAPKRCTAVLEALAEKVPTPAKAAARGAAARSSVEDPAAFAGRKLELGAGCTLVKPRHLRCAGSDLTWNVTDGAEMSLDTFAAGLRQAFGTQGGVQEQKVACSLDGVPAECRRMEVQAGGKPGVILAAHAKVRGAGILAQCNYRPGGEEPPAPCKQVFALKP